MKHLLLFFIISLLLVPWQTSASVPVQETAGTKIVVGGDYRNPPYEYLEDGKPTGFSIELIQAVAEVEGLDLEIRLAPWVKVREELEQGKIDAVAGMYFSPERARKVEFSVPHTLISSGIFVRKGSPINSFADIKGKEVIVQKGDVIHDFLVKNNITPHIVAINDSQDELRLLASGKFDCAFMYSRLQGEYMIKKEGLHNIRVVNSGQPPFQYCFAVRKGNRELVQRLDEGLNILKANGRYGKIYDRWFGVYEKRDLNKLLIYLVPPLVLFVILFLASFFWSRSLQSKVRIRTEELKNELDERRKVESDLVKSEERLSRFFDATFEGIFFHQDGLIVDINPATSEILGYSPCEVTGRNIMEFIAPDSRARVLEAMKIGEQGPYEVNCLMSNGNLKPVEIRARTLDVEGTATRVVGFRDISERKRIENELRRYHTELEAKTDSLEAIRSIADRLHRSLDLQTVAEQAVQALMARSNSPSVAIFLLDEEGAHLKLLYCRGFTEPLMERITRFPSRGSLSGVAIENRRVTISTNVMDDYRIEPAIREGLLADGYTGVVSVPLLAEEKVLGVLNLLYHDCSMLPSAVEKELFVIGQTVGLAISHALNIANLHEEMAERQRAEEELQRLNAELEKRVIQRTSELAEAKDRAEEADRIKSAFLATMSHELRTPLNSIIGFTAILHQGMSGPLNDEQKKQLSMVRGSAKHLLELINDVLDLSKIEAGQLSLANQTFDIREAIEEACRSMQPQAESKGLSLAVNIGPGVGAVTSDRRRVEQVILNLLSNAVKFTESGNVDIFCRENGNYLNLTVRDTGIGMNQEDLGKLFQPFRQVDTGLNRRFEGTGLGLCICRKLVDLLGGEIWAESEEGRGSTFSFTLPCSARTA